MLSSWRKTFLSKQELRILHYFYCLKNCFQENWNLDSLYEVYFFWGYSLFLSLHPSYHLSLHLSIYSCHIWDGDPKFIFRAFLPQWNGMNYLIFTWVSKLTLSHKTFLITTETIISNIYFYIPFTFTCK